MSKRDELDTMAVLETYKYQEMLRKEREELRASTKKLGEDIPEFIRKDYRGETKIDEAIEKYLVPAVQLTSLHPEKSRDLVNASVAIIRSKMYRVEHPRFQRLLELDFHAQFIEAVGGHSQIESAITHETEAHLSKKTRIHNFVIGLKKFFGGGKSADSDWTDK